LEQQYSFEKLEIWKIAKDLSIQVYKCLNDFPKSEKFGIVSQLGRAVISISSNIAEGTSRKSLKEQAHFIEIAYGSMLETLSILTITVELGYIESQKYLALRNIIVELGNKLNAYRNYLLNNANINK
jgi:four helix bundle protein